MKTNNYTNTDTTTLSNSSKSLLDIFDQQLMEMLQSELSKIKATKETSTKQLAA